MSINVFSSLIDAIPKIWNSIKKIKNIPKETRDYYRENFRDTINLIDAAIIMIITRLRDLLICTNELERINDSSSSWSDLSNKLHNELFLLDSFDDWLRIEREVRLCRNLRVAEKEMNKIIEKYKTNISIQDTERFREKFQDIFRTEGELASYIAGSLKKLSELTFSNNQQLKEVKNSLMLFKKDLLNEHQSLITFELEILEVI